MLFVAKTDQGIKRERNEDYYLTSSITNNIDIFIVADGMGGHKAGNIASKLTADHVLKNMKDKFKNLDDSKVNTNIIKYTLEKAIKESNTIIHEMSLKEEYEGMGTTLIVVVKFGEKYCYISIGDSRIYHINGNEIERLTEDDTYVNALLKNNTITEKEANIHPKKHILTKAIGAFSIIDFKINKFEENKGYLLLCTDGVTNLLKDKEILNIFKKNEFDEIPEKIINKCNDNGGSDNITALIISLEGDIK